MRGYSFGVSVHDGSAHPQPTAKTSTSATIPAAVDQSATAESPAARGAASSQGSVPLQRPSATKKSATLRSARIRSESDVSPARSGKLRLTAAAAAGAAAAAAAPPAPPCEASAQVPTCTATLPTGAGALMPAVYLSCAMSSAVKFLSVHVPRVGRFAS